MKIEYKSDRGKLILVTLSDENTLLAVDTWKWSCATYEWVELSKTNAIYKQVENNLNKIIKLEDFNSFKMESSYGN